ncbi:MAG TPA: cellulose binding domain-containing protein, partial [Candidatus Limnocylindrales bacterium]
GATLVGGGVTDSYTVRLTKKPTTGTVTVAIAVDGQTDVRAVNGAPVTLVLIGELVPVLLFTGSVTFNTTAKTITRASGSFLTDGFAAGMPIRITGTNAGDYTIASVTATTITLTTSFPTNGSATNVKISKLVPNGVFTGSVSFDAVNNRLIRNDGGSWLADGFLEGQRVRISGIGDFKIALIRGTSVLQFTAERALPAQAASVRTVTRLGAVLTFTTTNWNTPQTVELQADPFYLQPFFRKGLKDFADQPRTPGRIRGPVTQVPETTTADRSLRTAVKLPGEADANLRPIGGDPSATLTGGYEITHSDEEWGNKFEAKIVITNMTGTAQNWTVTLTFPPRVTGLAAVWVDGQSAPTAVRNGQTWTITGTGPVPPGGTITLMVQFFVIPRQPGEGDPNPTDCRVNGLACEMP